MDIFTLNALIVVGGAALFATVGLLWLLSGAWVVVPAESLTVIERQGVFSRILHAGWHLVLWPVECARTVCWSYMAEDAEGNVGRVEAVSGTAIFMGDRTYDFPPIEVVTSDRLNVRVNGLVFYRFVDVQKAVYGSADPLAGLQHLVVSGLRSALSRLSYEKAVDSQDEIRAKLIDESRERLQRWGIELLDLRIQSITPSKAILESTEALIKARRGAEALALQRTAEQSAQVTAARTDAEVRAIQQEAELQRDLLAAKSDAACIRTRSAARAEAAKLEAEGKRALSEAVGADVRIAEIYSSALRSASRNSKGTLVLPYDAAKAMGGLSVAQALLGAHKD